MSRSHSIVDEIKKLPREAPQEGIAKCNPDGDSLDDTKQSQLFAAGEDLPEHLATCTCDEVTREDQPTEDHDAVCRVCSYHITIGTDGTEYGHACATNRRDGEDCPHRPSGLDPHRGGADERRHGP